MLFVKILCDLNLCLGLKALREIVFGMMTVFGVKFG